MNCAPQLSPGNTAEKKITRKLLPPAVAILKLFLRQRMAVERSQEKLLVWITAKDTVLSKAPRNSQKNKPSKPSFRFWGGFFLCLIFIHLNPDKMSKASVWGRPSTPTADLNFLSYIRFLEDRLTRWENALIYFLSTHRSSLFSLTFPSVIEHVSL